MKKLIIMMLTAAMFFVTIPVNAMTMEQIGDKTVRLSGNTGGSEEMVALDVFVDGVSRADLEGMKESGGNLLDVWVAHLQEFSDEEGNFQFEFDITLPSGKYTAYAGVQDNEFEPYTFVFVSNSDFATMAEKINTASVEEIVEILTDKNECYVVGFSEEEIAEIRVESLAGVLQKTLESMPFDKENRDASWLIADKAYLVEQLNEGKVSNLYNMDTRSTDFEHSDIAEWYQKDYVSENLKTDFTNRMSGKNLEDYAQYKDALLEAFVLATVKYPSGTLDVENIITQFQDEIGVSVTRGTPLTVWNQLAGKDYSDFASLKEDFDKYSANSSGGNSGGTSGGSSGGGSSGGAGSNSHRSSGTVGTVVNIPVDSSDAQKETIDPDIFSDIQNVEWAKEAIIGLAERNIVSGIGNHQFDPDGNVTREQFVKMVVEAFVPEAEAAQISFSDIEMSAWYAEPIAKAVGKGIVNGTGNGQFGIGLNITRQDMCVMIYRAAQAAGITFESSEAVFEDDASIADYAKEAVYALKNSNAISGIGNDRFAPLEFATRAQAAKIIYSLIK